MDQKPTDDLTPTNGTTATATDSSTELAEASPASDNMPTSVPGAEQPASSFTDGPAPVIAGGPAKTAGSGWKRALLTLLVIVLLAAAAAALYLFVLKKDKAEAPAVVSTTSQSILPKAIVGTPVSTFYYIENGTNVTTVNLTSGKTDSLKLKLDDERFLQPNDAPYNNTVQIVDKGQKVFFESSKPKLPITEGEGEPIITSVLLSAWQNDSETKLAEFKMADGVELTSWIVTKDGSTVYYLTRPASKATGFNLYSLAVESKKTTLIKEKIAAGDSAGVNAPLSLTPTGRLLLFSNDGSYALTEHVVTEGAYSEKALGNPGCNCMLEYPQPVSSDGTKLLLQEQTSGTVPADFNYYVFNLTNSKLQKIAGPLRNEEWRATLWSPTGTQVMYDTASFDQKAGYVPKIVLRNVTDGKESPLFSGGATRSLLSWSPDVRYVAYTQDDKIQLFDLINQKQLGVTVPTNNVSAYGYGWY